MIKKRHSIRLNNYDYCSAGAYFVTICTQDKKCLFGNIIDGKMILNKYGEIVNNEWLLTAKLRNNIEMDEFIIMPNHFHGIICLFDLQSTDTKHHCRGTVRRAPMVEQFGKPVSGSLPTIIRAFKSAVTKRINEIRNTSSAQLWQRNYYEHIIRNENVLHIVREYIVNNPAKWDLDKENPFCKNENCKQDFV